MIFRDTSTSAPPFDHPPTRPSSLIVKSHYRSNPITPSPPPAHPRSLQLSHNNTSKLQASIHLIEQSATFTSSDSSTTPHCTGSSSSRHHQTHHPHHPSPETLDYGLTLRTHRANHATPWPPTQKPAGKLNATVVLPSKCAPSERRCGSVVAELIELWF